MEDSLRWLPAGWIMEIKTRKGGTSAGNQYKCYIDPVTGSKFYSKQEVFRYLKTGRLDREIHKPKRRKLNTLSADNVVSRIEKSPDGLPSGWTKEIKFRKKSLGHGFRKDPYYTDPVTGCVFRSKRDVVHYLETGNLGTRACQPKKMCGNAQNSTDSKLSSPVAAKRQKLSSKSARRCLFESRSLNINGATSKQISGPTLEKQRGEDVDSSSLGCTKEHSKTRKRKRVQMKKGSAILKDKLLESRDKKLLVNGMTLESEDKKLIENEELDKDKQLTHVALSELEDKKQENRVLLEARNRNLSCKGVPLESGENDEIDGEVLLAPQDAEGVLKESEHTEKQLGNRELEMDKQLVPNVGLSELEDDKRKSGVLLESRKKLSRNGVPPELEDNRQQTGSGVLLESQDGKPLENWVLMVSEDTKPQENGVQLESEAKTPLGESQVEEKRKTGRVKLRSSKVKGEKATLMPRRTSKRLAGLEAEVALDISYPEKAHRVAAKHLADRHPVDSTPSGFADQVSEQHDQLKFILQADPIPCTSGGTKGTEEYPEKPMIEKPPADEKPDSPFVLPFGDSWPDPCLEFAFKTLTGDIPVATNTMAIEEYFQQQLGFGQTQNLGYDDFLQPELLFQSGKDTVGPMERGMPGEKGKPH